MILHEAAKLKCIPLPSRVKAGAKRVSDLVQGRDTPQPPRSDKPYRREGEEEIPRNCFVTASNHIVPVKWIDEVFWSNWKWAQERQFCLAEALEYDFRKAGII
jgi:hypothetical protein